jgi:hypothetical protein
MPDDLGRMYAVTLIPNGEFSKFYVRDWEGKLVCERVCGESEATRLRDEYVVPQSTSLDLFEEDDND